MPFFPGLRMPWFQLMPVVVLQLPLLLLQSVYLVLLGNSAHSDSRLFFVFLFLLLLFFLPHAMHAPL